MATSLHVVNFVFTSTSKSKFENDVYEHAENTCLVLTIEVSNR